MMVPPSGILALTRWQRFGLLMALWTTLGLIDAGQFYVHVRYFRSRTIYWEEAIVSGLADWYVWALVAPFVFHLARRFPIGGRHWPRRLLLHVLAGTGFVAVKLALDLPLAFLIHGQDVLLRPSIGDTGPQRLARYAASYATFKAFRDLIACAVIVGVAHLLDYYQKFRERELLASQLGERLVEARLLVLRMQLHPHFLFNTLNAISALMHSDVRVADRMLARLADLLRAALADPGSHDVPLARELSFLTPYLEIEQARLGDRLGVTVDVPADLSEARVPYLFLQPLVENAIRHGIAPRPGPGRLAVRARRRGNRLEFEVSDDGAGLPGGEPCEEGIGLSNTRARLRGLYGDDQSLTLRPGPGGGLTVTVSLPYRESAAEHNGAPVAVDNGAAVQSSKTP